MKKIVFMGAKAIGLQCLQFLYEQQSALQYEIVGVLTNARGMEMKSFCHTYDLPLLKTLDDYLALATVDIVLSVQYDQILRSHHINKAEMIAINLHMAPLPEYRGCNQFSFAIINQDKMFGTTLHRLEEGVDSGAIIAEQRFEIPEGIWVKDLVALTEKHSFELFQSKLSRIIQGNFILASQDCRKTIRREFHRRAEIQALKRIDLSWDAEKIKRYLRATYMPGFPAPYFMLGERKISFLVNEREDS